MKISTPPSFFELQQEFLRHLTDTVKQAEKLGVFPVDPEQISIKDYPDFTATDEKGRYLHWDKFKRIYAEDTRMKWRAVKESRLKAYRKIRFAHGHEFVFCTPDSLQSQLHYVDKTCGSHIGTQSLAGFGQGEQSRFLLKSLVMEEAITSAQLEGAATTRKVAKDMLKTDRKPKTKDELMIVNNYRLMREAFRLKDQEINTDLILQLHFIATQNAIDNKAIPGTFRQDDEIFISGRDGEPLYQPPPFEQIQDLMQDFCHFANQEHNGTNHPFIHPVVKAIILHFLIGYIHPFGDGNGRTARALFYWFMLKNGYWLFEYISISRLLKNAPAKYAKSYLYTETDGLDMSYFIYYQLEIIQRAIADLHGYISNKQTRLKEFKSAIAGFAAKIEQPLNDRQVRILQKAVEESGKVFTALEVSNEYGISLNTARKDLSLLGELRLLVQFKSGNAFEYIAPSDLLERLEKKHS